jgi:hypothetical protein
MAALVALPSLKPIDRADGGRQQREFSQPIDDVEGAVYLRHSPPARPEASSTDEQADNRNDIQQESQAAAHHCEPLQSLVHDRTPLAYKPTRHKL